MKTNLLKQFAGIRPEQGSFVLAHLGQHSFLLRTEEKTIAFDPYLSNDPERLIPPFISPEEFTGIDFILGSHDHGDHIDRKSLAVMAEASPSAVFVFPKAVIPSVTEIPGGRMIGLNDSDSVVIDGIRITGIAAAHEFLDCEPATGLYPYLGFVVETDGAAVYHAGDCCIYEGLQTKLSKWHFSLMILPINGRDARRLKNNCIGNMTYQEAADLAGNLCPDLVIPAHYDMFRGNTENPQLFLDYMQVKYPKVSACLPPAGKAVKFNRKEGLYGILQ